MRALIVLALGFVIALLLPLLARAEPKDPLAYPLKQYGFVLGIALLGGLVGWYAKVRKGEVLPWNLMQLIGELCTSAFAGLLAFWLCELGNAPALLTASIVGISGHMGTRAIQTLENFVERRWRAKFGADPAAPSGEPK
nr:phage holin family protein [uncultured Roseateles sp.]